MIIFNHCFVLFLTFTLHLLNVALAFCKRYANIQVLFVCTNIIQIKLVYLMFFNTFSNKKSRPNLTIGTAYQQIYE